MQWFKYSLIAASVCCASLVAAAEPQVYTLKNGLKLVVKPDHRAPVAIAQIWYKAGSADEQGGTTGLAHMTEHMMFKGTPNHPTGDLSKIIADNGGQENAFTDDDFTVYFQKLASDRIEVAFKLESDRMRNLILKDDEFKKELEVVKEERRMRMDDSPEYLTYERLRAAAFLSHPYHHMTIGWMSDLNQLSVNDVKQWYQTWYAPNNATLVIVGDVDPEAMHQLAERYFGSIKSSLLPVRKENAEPPPVGQRELVTRIPAQVSALFMAYNVPSRLTDASWKPYALTVLAGILSAGDSSRLHQDLVQKQGIASNGNVDYQTYARYSTLFLLQATPAEGKSLEVLQAALLQQIKNLQTTTVSPDELARVKTQIIAKRVFSKDSQSGQAMEIGALETIGLGWQEGDKFIANVKAITPEQLKQVAVEFLQPDRLTIARLEAQPMTGAPKPTPTTTGGDAHA
jgi:zinc protease